MSRLTINESANGYTDKIILTPGDFTTAAGNSTTQVDIPVAIGDVIDGAAMQITEAFSVNHNIKVGYDADVTAGAAVTEAFIANKASNATSTAVNTGSHLDDGGDANNTRVVATGAGNITIISAGDLSVSTSGKIVLQLSIKRI
jgi:hypothetical protein